MAKKEEVGALDEFHNDVSELDVFEEKTEDTQEEETETEEESEEEESDTEGEGSGEELDKSKGTEGKEEPEPKKNRHHRRLERRLSEADSLITALNERVKVLSETDKFKADTGDLDTDLARIYGAETPQQAEATRILQSSFKRYADKAKAEALQEFEQRQQAVVEATRKAEGFVTSELEGIEDDFDVDLTSDAPAARKRRAGLLELVSKLSPKDKDGNITDYADFGAAYEMYQSQQEKRDGSRKKAVVSRTMTKSGSSSSSAKLADEVAENWLKANGII